MRYTEYFFTLLQAKEMPQLGNVTLYNTVCVGRRRRAESTRAGTPLSGAGEKAGWSNCLFQYTHANPASILL